MGSRRITPSRRTSGDCRRLHAARGGSRDITRGLPDSGTHSLQEQAHLQRVVVHTLEAHALTLDGLAREADALVEADRALVVSAHLEFDARQALGARFLEAGTQQPF